MKIGYQGAPCCHSHVAIDDFIERQRLASTPTHPLLISILGTSPAVSPTLAHTPVNEIVEAKGYPTVTDLLEAVISFPPEIDLALVPIENAHSGTFTQSYDQLSKYLNRLSIVGEHIVQQENQLMMRPVGDGSSLKLEEISCVVTHAMVIDQCAQLIQQIRDARETTNLGPVDVLSMEDTASACRYARDQPGPEGNRVACLANPVALEEYGLVPIPGCSVSSITRYWLVGSVALSPEQLASCEQKTKLKTSIAVVLPNQTGSLMRALSCFGFRDIGVSQLVTRPVSMTKRVITSTSWEYQMFLDLEAGTHETRTRKALNNLQDYSQQIHVLGSYPKFS